MLTNCSKRVQQLRDERSFQRLRIAKKIRALERANFAKRPFNEKQLALNLAQFASSNNDLDLGSDQVENLVGTLIVSSPLLSLDFWTIPVACANSHPGRSSL